MGFAGPVSIAGLSGPDLKELPSCQPGVPSGPMGAGEVRLATEGRPGNLPGVSVEGLPKDCSKGLGSNEKCVLLCCPLK